MGRNRKWVLEDSLQDAVWKTILRGPRPPSVRWEKPRNQSAAATHQSGAKRNKSSSVKTEAKKKDPPQAAPPRRESITPDAAQVAARQRVGKLEAILSTLEDDDETAAVTQVALTKARAQAQERPFPERVESTRKFVERQQKRVEQARVSAAKAKEALAEAVACQEKEESLLADGEERLSQLRAAAQRVPSPFTVPPVPVVPDITDEMQRMQRVTDELQRELTPLKGSPVCRPVDATAKDDEGMGLDGSSVMSGLINDAQAKRPRLALCGGRALDGSPS